MIFEENKNGLVFFVTDFDNKDAQSVLKQVNELKLNGFSNWRFPMEKDLLRIYEKISVNGPGNFADYFFWKYTKDSNDGVWGIMSYDLNNFEFKYDSKRSLNNPFWIIRSF